MSATTPFYVEGVQYHRGVEFLTLAAAAAAECPPGQFCLRAQTAQVMAAVAAEAFMNETTALLLGLKRTGKAPELSKIGTILEKLEESRVQIAEKFVIVSELLPGIAFCSGTEPLQSFRMLIGLRNLLVHPKTGQKPPKWFSTFVSNGLTVQRGTEEALVADWQRQLQSSQCAAWACRASARIILAVVERLRDPCYAQGVPGLHQALEMTWSFARDDRRIWSSD
jgi:hypothetical protein